jgi:hypothetical protein
MWLATTGREFDEEVIEQLAVTPKFVVRGEVLPSYGQILPATSEDLTVGAWLSGRVLLSDVIRLRSFSPLR